MPIHIDVIAQMNERAAEDVARGLENTFAKAGEGAGEAFSRHLGQAFGNLDKETQSALDKVVHRADVAGEAIGAALISGISGAALALEKIGDQFEVINRGIQTTTLASGAALDELKSHADALVGSLDTSAEAIGSTMGTLATRLRTTAGTELDTLTKHVTELSDRMGNINVGNLGAGFVQFRVGAAQADDTLASLLQTSRQYAVGLPTLVDNLAQFGVVLNGVHLNMEQSAHMMGELAAAGVPLQQGLMGLEVAANAWAKPDIGKGRDFVTFVRDAAESMEYYDKIGNQVARDEIAVKIFSQRRWEQAEQAAQIYLATIRQTPDAFKASGDGIDKFTEDTRTLHNAWHEFRNAMDVALQGPATHFVDELTDKLKEFGDWCRDHQQDLANLFKTASEVAGGVITALMKILELLGQHPGYIQAAAAAFIAWESIKGVEAVIGGLRTISALLTGLPAESAAAGAGITAGLAPAIAALSALATGLVLWNEKGSSAPTNIGPGADDRQRKLDAGKAYADSHGGQVPPGYAQWLDKGGPVPPGITMPGAAPGTPFFDAQGRPLDASGHPIGGPAPAPGGPGAYVPGSKSFAPGAPEAPKPPEVPGAPGAPGDVPGGLITPGDFDPKKKGPRLPVAPEVPYGAGYGEAPRPGESAKQYEHEQAILEKRHAIDEDVARLNQLEADNNATAADIQKARNKLLHDQSEFYKTEESQLRKRGDDMEQIGAKIDKDFGISKGLAGIAENLFKFLANLAAAPVFGALQGANAAIGGPTYGGHGLIGAAALGGAFGPQFTPEVLAAEGASPGSGPEGRTHTGGRYGYQGERGGRGGAEGVGGGPLGGAAASGAGWAGSGVPLVQNSDGSWTSPNAAWAHLINRESGGRNIIQSPSTQDVNSGGNEAFGIFQITPGTWASHGGQGSVYNSTPQEQAIVAARILRGNPSGGDWGAGRSGREDAGALLAGLGAGGTPGVPGLPGGHVPGFDPSQAKNGWTPHPPAPPGPPLPGVPGGTAPAGPWNAAPGDIPGMMLPPPHYDQGGAIDFGVAGSSYQTKLGGVQENLFRSWVQANKVPFDLNESNSDYDMRGYWQATGGAPWSGGHFPDLFKTPSHATFSNESIYSRPDNPWGWGPNGDTYGRYADGGALPNSGGGIPIMAHEGEHVLTKDDVSAMGGQSGVYALRKDLHTQDGQPGGGPDVPKPGGPQQPSIKNTGTPPIGGPQPGKSMIGAIAPSSGYGSGFQVTGGGLVGLAESLPATAASMGMAAAAAALYGGAIEDLAHYQDGGAVPATSAGAGGSPGGAGGGGAPGSSAMGALIGIGFQELNEAISKGGQATGAIVGGLQQTFGPQQFAQSKLAQSGWISKLVGGFTGAHPQLPNTAGGKGSTPGLTPEQAASEHQGAGGAPGPGGPPAPSEGPLVHIENLNNYGNENSLGKSVGDHVQGAYNIQGQTGGR